MPSGKLSRDWKRETWDVLMDDETEYLDIVVRQADHNAWPEVALRHKWDDPMFTRHAVQFGVWRAGQRAGIIPADVTFEYFIEHIDSTLKRQEQINPTEPATSAG